MQPARECPIKSHGGEYGCGTKNHLDHEGLRTGRRQPAYYLQLVVEREDRIRANRRRFCADLRRYAVARPAARRPAGCRERVAAHGRAQPRLTCRLSAWTTCLRG